MMSSTTFDLVAKVVRLRRSVFPVSYYQREIPKTVLLELLDCANAAPTHKLTQPWRFVIFRGNGLIRLADELARLYKVHTPAAQFLEKKFEQTREKVLQSGAVVAIVVAYSGAVPRWEELAATACAVQNLWLTASSAGIGGYWSTPATTEHLGSFLKLADNETCIGLFYMGYHGEPEREPNRTPITEKIRWEE